LTDLIPYLHKKHAQDGFFRQTALLLLGVAWLPALAMWTASHWVKLLTAALAPLYF
jgi:hypothetical protein